MSAMPTKSIFAVIGVLLVAFVFKVTVLPSTTVAGAGPATMSIYDLHAGYPDVKDLPVQEAPLP